ncbi:hypothetical protein E4U26_002995 [Claviceps purpurea]|nr:hypothetical protein E4U26_002995 [Claviceps purpurea]
MVATNFTDVEKMETKTVSGKIRSRHRRQHQHDADSSFKLKIPCSENSAFFHFGFTASL